MIRPYSIKLFNEKEIEEMLSNNNVLDGTNTTSHSTDIASSPQSVANILRKYIIALNRTITHY